ncbi:hypothetical protein EC970003_1278, partial [Escherichia coli 97.0003]
CTGGVGAGQLGAGGICSAISGLVECHALQDAAQTLSHIR